MRPENFQISRLIPNIGVVELRAQLSDFELMNEGIGGYEYFGFRGYDHGSDYLHLEVITWDESLYSPQQNTDIDNWLGDMVDMEGCPYAEFCEMAEPHYQDYIEGMKEAYALRNL
jgi:hypothetical protein